MPDSWLFIYIWLRIIYLRQMKIFRGFYLVALPIILIGLPFLFYM